VAAGDSDTGVSRLFTCILLFHIQLYIDEQRLLQGFCREEAAVGFNDIPRIGVMHYFSKMLNGNCDLLPNNVSTN
jgi:hypothetical protein